MGIVALIRALGVHIENPTALLWSAIWEQALLTCILISIFRLSRILTVLSEDEQLQSLIGIHNGIIALFKVIRKYVNINSVHYELQESCTETVALVAYHNPANVSEIIKGRIYRCV